jgi:hypothetical protein
MPGSLTPENGEYLDTKLENSKCDINYNKSESSNFSKFRKPHKIGIPVIDCFEINFGLANL